MDMNRRHRRLAKRVRCGFVWDSKHRDADHPEHHCDAFAGHMSPHRCRCGGGSTRNVAGARLVLAPVPRA